MTVPFHAVWAVLFHGLFKPVSRSLGFWCVLTGCLVYRSTFLPRIIGVLELLAGLGYLTLLWQPLARYLYPYNLALAGPGEISLLL
jgi:hypothetical protein